MTQPIDIPYGHNHDPTYKRIYLVRHAQAEHNVASDWSILDPTLTKVGRKQCGRLCDETIDTIQETAELLVTSPLRRTLETTIHGFPELKKRLENQDKPVILFDLAQEAGDMPCDTPIYPPEALAASNDGMFIEAGFDFSQLSPDYASKVGIYDPDNAAERAKLIRLWLRQRPEREIVLVAHGDILRYVVDGYHSSRRWRNAQAKEFGFAYSDDEDAILVERDPSQSPMSPTSPLAVCRRNPPPPAFVQTRPAERIQTPLFDPIAKAGGPFLGPKIGVEVQ